jgi:hypothetical protein
MDRAKLDVVLKPLEGIVGLLLELELRLHLLSAACARLTSL